MMRFMRFSIAGLMGAVLIVALGLAALRSASATWSSATFLATCGLLCLAVVGAVCGGDAERTWWLGFALFGWGYVALAFWSRDANAARESSTSRRQRPYPTGCSGRMLDGASL
jgi:hypothetical protein